MKIKMGMFITGIILSIFITGFILKPTFTSPNTYELKIVKIDNVWRVVDATDSTKTKIKVKKKDTVIWTAEGTDAYFQFPETLFNPVSAKDSLHNGYTKFLKNGKKLKLKVKDNAPAGTYEYSVFCTPAGVYARGDSPPKIIVE